MTPTLKAMVEAMAANMEDQIEAMKVNGAWASFVNGRLFASGDHSGYFDLEKVARAGLEVVKQQGSPSPTEESLETLFDLHRADDSAGVLATMIDAILREKP